YVPTPFFRKPQSSPMAAWSAFHTLRRWHKRTMIRAISREVRMRFISFAASGRSSYGAVVGDGVVDFGRRFGDRYPTLRAAIAGGGLEETAVEVSGAAPDIALSQ